MVMENIQFDGKAGEYRTVEVGAFRSSVKYEVHANIPTCLA